MMRPMIVSATLLILLAGGCAKRPATVQGAAPAPAGAAGATASRPSTPAPRAAASTSGGAAGRSDAIGARPAPRDFVANPALRDIGFDFDKYEIRPGDAKILDASAAWLRDNARQRVLIEGHSDERGTDEYNLALGERRAKAAMTYLVAQGVQASRIAIVSYGEERSLCREHVEACWARNRRAHFLVKLE